MADQAIYAPFRVLDANGVPVSGALAYFYAVGSDTLLAIYEDEDEITLAENPVEADASGALPQRYFTGEARVVVKTPAGVTLYTFNPVPRSVSSTSSASAVPFANTANIPALNVQDAIELADTNARARDAALDAAKQPVDATLTSLSGLLLVEGDLFYATAADTLVRLAKGTAGQVLRMNAGATAPEWGDVVGKLLGTITTTSGATQTLSGLTLTGYRKLELVFKGVSGTSSATLSFGTKQICGTIDTASGLLTLDLATGVFMAGVYTEGGNGAIYTGTTTYSTASTSISVGISTGAFDAGAISVWGIR